VATLGVDRDDRDWCLAGVVRPEPGRGFGLAGSADDAYRRAPVVTDSAGCRSSSGTYLHSGTADLTATVPP